MADLPLLPLPTPAIERRKPGNQPRESVSAPSRGRQSERLGPKFARLEAVSGTPEQLAALQADPNSIAPERAIVFEVVSTLADFIAATRKVPGLEPLGEEEIDAAPDEDFATDKPQKPVSERLYFAMPDQRALGELLSLWRGWERDGSLPRGYSVWRPIFERLRDVRPWGPEDRLEAETRAIWQEQLAEAPAEPIRAELELWFRERQEDREAALANVEQSLTEVGGDVLRRAEIPQIRYAAVLARLPAAAVRTMLENPAVSLAKTDALMFIRPQSLASTPEPEVEPETEAVDASALERANEPLAALLDGLPVTEHILLSGRLTVEDPDDLAAQYGSAAEQRHGTEMASLILHGDLDAGEPPLTRRLYVRPVLHGDGPGRPEVFPNKELPIDLIYRAVRRLFEGEESAPPSAPSVKLINLSLGDKNRPFTGLMSPWARLVDYLSYRYGALFLVSAGNVPEPLELDQIESWSELEHAASERRRDAVLRSVSMTRSQRSLLAPAESLNALTVGALHENAGIEASAGTMSIDPYEDGNLPNVASALGLGFRRSIKPDLLFPGGRIKLQMLSSASPVRARLAQPRPGSGVKAATIVRPGELDRAGYTDGTSAAAALATRAAHRVLDAFLESAEAEGREVDPRDLGLIAKVLLVHGTGWSAAGSDPLETVIAATHGYTTRQWALRRDDAARFLGYGICDVERLLACTEQRATLVGVGEVRKDETAVFRFPLPISLSDQSCWRAVTTTIAWFTPVSSGHRFYRDVRLKLEDASDGIGVVGVARKQRPQPTDNATFRGSVVHERGGGQKAVTIDDEGRLEIRVACTSPTGALENADVIRFALAVSIEAGIETGLPIFEEVRSAIGAQIGAQIPI